jgi:ADP-ribose pyrophosphatase YjhB (NUDIX family)
MNIHDFNTVVSLLTIFGVVALLIFTYLANKTRREDYRQVQHSVDTFSKVLKELNGTLSPQESLTQIDFPLTTASQTYNPKASSLRQVVCAVILDGDKLLSVTRRNKSLVCLPGGKIESNESLTEGLSREVLEETNLIIPPEHWVKVYENSEFDDNLPDTEYWSTTFMVDKKHVLNVNELKQMEDGIVPEWLTWNAFFERDAFPDYDKVVKENIDKYFQEHDFIIQ